MVEIGILVILGLVIYLLYLRGYIMFQSKRAVVYIGSRRGKKAKFSACSGYTKRIVRFEESKAYHFTFNATLRKGTVTAELMDANKQSLCILSADMRQCSVAVECKKRYYLIFHFREATGEYELEWS